MPILKNSKHELFAQYVAKGTSYSKSYELAGYKYDRSAAARTANYPKVAARILELKAAAAERAILSRAQIIEMLLVDRELAQEAGQIAAAVRVSELLGKDLGMWLNEAAKPDPAALPAPEGRDAMSDRELARRMAFLLNRGAPLKVIDGGKKEVA